MGERSLTQPWTGTEGEILRKGGWHLNGNLYKGRIDSWYASRCIFNLDTMEQSTVIEELAKTKWPGVDLSKVKLYWIDANMINETLENIGIELPAAAGVTSGTGRGRPAGNQYGARAGSPEYNKAWREKNRDKLNAAQKRYKEKIRALAAVGKEALASTTQQDRNVKPVEDSHLDDMQRMLQQIEEMTKGEANGTDHRD